MYLNKKYFEESQRDGTVINNKIECNDFNYLKDLEEKYIKIIKEKIQVQDGF